MKALTVRQPWAHLVAHHGKWIENRSWVPPTSLLGERIAIHAGQTLGLRYDGMFLMRGGEIVSLPAIIPDLPPPHELVYGAVIATATLTGWVEEQPHPPGTPATELRRFFRVSRQRAQDALESHWWVGPVGWVLDDVVPITPPSTCRGRLGIWDLGRATEREVLVREEAARAG